MTPPSANPSPEDMQQVAKDGVIAGALGSAAMVARMLLSTEPVTFGWVCRRILAAAITAAFVGWAVSEHIQSIPLRFAATGAAGYAAPEVLDYLLKYVKAKGEAKVAEARKGLPRATKAKPKRRK